MANLYETVTKLCEEKGISGYRMAKECGISPGWLTDLKAGRRKGASAETANKIANYFGITVDELLNPDIKKDPAEDEVDLQEEIAKLKKRTEGSSVFFNGKELDLETIAAINASLDVIEKMLEAK